MKTIIMLMTMTVGTLAASAQSAGRATAQSDDSRKSSKQLESRSPRSEAQQRESSASRQTTQSRTATPKPQYDNRGNSGHSSTAQPQQRTNIVREDTRKTSTTTSNNPRSNYREPDRTTHVGKTFVDPKPGVQTTNKHSSNVVRRNENTYSNHGHSHTYYPRHNVKIHVHPVTYQNHYKVMYYPAHREIIWTNQMNRYYLDIYPGYTWRYPIGYGIQTISAFEARYNIGEVSRVYGRVYGTWYNNESDDLLLFFGGEYPNQEFTMIIPGDIARRYSWRPERYFLGQHVYATGLITSFEGKPEMLVKRKNQLDIY